MAEIVTPKLKVVDATTLDETYREVLRPGAVVHDREGRGRRLPRYFFEIDSRKTARSTVLAPCFSLYEFVHTDIREAEVLRGFPRYIPCAVVLLAAQLSLFRSRVGTYVHIAANGAYRSPGHGLSTHASPHQWGTAVNIYRIGDDFLEDEETIARYAALLREVLPFAWIRPYGHGTGQADDHLHVDIGYVSVVPHDAEGEKETTTPDAPAEEAP